MMKKGFTLIEVITALSVFTVVMTISMGSILGIFDANRKSESLKSVMDNLNFAMESMAREIRFGKNYDCGSLGGALSCPEGSTTFSFTNQNNQGVTYTRVGNSIQKSSSAVAGGSYIDITAPEVVITSLQFFVVGAETYNSGISPGNRQQPRVLIQIKGYSGVKQTSKSNFVIQTLVTQRIRDN